MSERQEPLMDNEWAHVFDDQQPPHLPLQDMDECHDVYIVCGHPDNNDFATKLSEQLSATDFDIWADLGNSTVREKGQNQSVIELEKSHALLLLISPRRMDSDGYCQAVEWALHYQKHIIPVVHVEQIGRDIDQQQFPQDSVTDWDKHPDNTIQARLAKTIPAIANMRWVIFREGIDNIDTSFSTLVDVLTRHRDYVHQHTHYLRKALDWEHNQRRSPLLLAPDACPLAHHWLHTSFLEEQAPCMPTDLHCEFITESLKQANNGMTQVFLSYSEENDVLKARLQQSLLRKGIIVWSNTTDIKTGEDFQEAINRGIERADNVVFLMSSQSLNSAFCQQEIRHAQIYHKRIIPLLIDDLKPGDLSVELQTLQFVDFLSKDTDDDFQTSVNALVRVLQDDANYYTLHKTLLVKALEWDTQKRRKDLLLRGNAFVDAENWLAVSQQTHKQSPPTRLHASFIQASQEINRYFDAFISYGRADSLDFAITLEQHLTKQGLNIWFDKTDIPFGVDFQEQINDGISKAHNLIFIISPHAVNSSYCQKEIELALQFNKRIIPLLHVEEISYDTWKIRHSEGSENDWHQYKANGLHSIFPNMHPAIGKINWVYFREDIDDYAQSLAGLTALFPRHQSYIEQHSIYLLQALDWEKHQRKTEYLLVGDDRIDAEQWLKTQFPNEQPPCRPTRLHTEFICESIKNANNLMTQVFISHAEADHLIREKVRYSLMYEGITVWINRTDIRTGTDFQAEINQGIEETDNVVWLMSPASLTSEYCRQELEYALYLNKRIIPLLIDTLEMADVPLGLQSLQFIDFQAHHQHEEYQQVLSKLLKSLDEDAHYHTQHKRLLVKALRWKHQKYNPSILLRGFELRHFQSWFQIAKQHHQFRPIPVQEEFIAESEKQPPDKTLNVFLSYSRADADFVRKLNQTLQIQGMTTWFDQENIESGEDFQAEIFNGIENSENFLFVISPSSVVSPFCKDEVDYAKTLNKRIVTVLYREVSNALLPLALANIQWLDFRKHGGDFLSNFGELLRTLASDPEHVQMHTRLLVRSREWEESGKDDSYLMRGNDLQAAVTWLKNADHHEPRPTDLQRDYIGASQALPFRRVNPRTVVFSSIAATVLVAIARFFGMTEGLELMSYDHLLRLRPSEAQDERITIVTVDSQSARDLRNRMLAGEYEPGFGTIPDGALADVLATLQQYQPRLIGLDFYRDFPATPVLATQMQQMNNLVAVCKNAETDEAGNSLDSGQSLPVEGYTPPPELPIEQVGFTDFVDDGSEFIRRHLLQQRPDATYCDTHEAFSLVIAKRYLDAEGYPYRAPSEQSDMMLGDTSISLLSGNGGGFQDMNYRLSGYQTLLNFRVHEGSAEQFVQSVSLQAVLDNTISPDDVRDRIILIGYTDRADINADYWDTPYGTLPGVYLQGQMISQLISTVIDNRRLIWWWPILGEYLWTLGWATLGGFTIWWMYRPKWLVTASVGLVIVLYGTCYIVLATQGGWLALVPTTIAMALTAGAVTYANHRIRIPR